LRKCFKILPASLLKIFPFFLFVFFYSTKIFSQQIIWEQTNGPANGKVWALAINEQDVIYAADDAKLFSSKDDGDSWEMVIDWTSEADEIVEITFNDSGHIFVGTFGGAGVYRSTDKGQTWLYPAFSLPGVNDIKVGHNGDIIAGTMLNVWISFDNGYNWVVKNQGLPEQTIIVCIFVDRTENYFIGTYGGGIERIYKSTNYGENWFASGNGLYNSVAIISIVDNSKNFLFAGSEAGQEVSRSTDSGVTWSYFGNGLLLGDITLITNNLDFVFAGLTFGAGVFLSTDDGELWYDYNTGLTNKTILSFALNSKGVLFTGTWGDGVFKTIRSTTNVERGVNEPIPDFFLMNYPNPFNSGTKIKFGLPESGNIVIDVYSTSGEKIESMVDEYLTAGSYSISLTDKKMASGVYFIVLRLNNNLISRKILLLK
jgi:photosystem II stability/assembly factor-like uncharacterized protein